jgi:LuxR family maltose regulon positive regulatory protein
MSYIRIPKVYEKLKKAEEFYAPVILTAAQGYGKSAAVEYYYRRKKPLILHCDGTLSAAGDVPEEIAAFIETDPVL